MIYILGGLLSLFLILGFGLSFWLSSFLKTTLNTNPERKYDIIFEDLSISLIRSSIELKKLEINPLNTEGEASIINASVEKAEIRGYSIWEFVISRRLTIAELSFVKPEFRLTHYDTISSHSKSSKPFQSLFGDVVSRGKIKNFSIQDGKAEYFIQGDSLRRIGGFREMNLQATGLETDSAMIGHSIPFQLDNVHTSFKDLNYQVADDQNLRLGSFEFDFKTGELNLKDFSLSYDKPWQEIAKSKTFQQDIIDFHMGSLSISKLNTSSRLYDSLLIIAGSVSIDSLVFNDGRDKNIPRPKDELKKDFTALLNALQFPLEVDSLFIRNSKITYSEIEKGNTEPGVLVLEDLNGLIINLASIDSVEKKSPLDIHIKAKLNGKGDLELKLLENYQSNSFEVDLSLGAMEMKDLNPTLINLAGIAIEAGQLMELSLEMEAGPTSSDNHFLMEYRGLKMDLLNEEDKKKGFLSSVANLAINKENLPENKHYKTPSYSTKRNIYRGPINLIWLSVKDGLMATIPTGMVQKLMPHSKGDKKSKRQLRKEVKKAQKAKD